MVGHLQRNKASALRHGRDTVHSVHSTKLAAALDAAAAEALDDGGRTDRCGYSFRSVWTATPPAGAWTSAIRAAVDRLCAQIARIRGRCDWPA